MTNLSLAQQLAALPEEERDRLLEGVDLEELQWDWSFWRRGNQTPPSDFWIWILSGGRGMGKTVSMVEWIREKALSMPGSRGALVARTAADVRDVIIQGESGLMARCPPTERPVWEPSKRLITFPNGSQALAFSSEEPSQLRGPQHHWAACVDSHSMVITPDGPKEIREITVGEYVLGSAGFTRVLASQATGIKPVMTVHAGDATLRATEDHRVWTPRGWVECAALNDTDSVSVWRTQAQKVHHPRGSDGTVASGTEMAKTSITGTATENCCIESYGPLQTVLSQRDMRFTIATMIGPTTDLRTLSAATYPIIGHTTQPSEQIPRGLTRRNDLSRVSAQSRCGTSVANPQTPWSVSSVAQSFKVTPCVRSTAAPSAETEHIRFVLRRELSHQSSDGSRSHVDIVEKSSSQRSTVQSSARIRARREQDGSSDLHTLRRSATGVIPLSRQSDQTQFTARGNAETQPVRSVHASRSTPILVWDLTTESHDYYANDILVHNCDELASWRWVVDDSGLNAWDHVRIGTRLGEKPQIVVATTPKRAPGFKQLLAEAETNPRIIVTHGSTRENVGNLSREYIDTIYGLYDGTALAAQELDGQLLGDVEGALWSSDDIDRNRVLSLPPHVLANSVAVIGVDPSVSETPRDLCGIVVVVGTREPKLRDRHVYILEDRSILGPPSVWATEVAKAAQEYGALIIAERNQGGGLIEGAITQVDPRLQIRTIHARMGKALRAEPVVLASQQGRVHIVGEQSELTDELTSWQPELSKKSPDRLDAMVYGCLAFLTAEGEKLGIGAGPVRIASNRNMRSARGRAATRKRTGIVVPADPTAGLPLYMRQAARGFWR